MKLATLLELSFVRRPLHAGDLFRTEHLHADLKGYSVRGGVATMAGQAANLVLKLGSTAILARLLTPADFGLIAMVTAVTGFVEMFKDAGLSTATVQRAEVDHRQVSTLFWINLVLSLGFMLIVAALAPAVAWFYGQPVLLAVTLALAAMFPLTGLAIQHQALLRRQMRFGALAAIGVASQAVGITAAIVAAAFGARYWALVAMMAASAISGVVLPWLLCPWRPGLPRRGTGVRPMLAFGTFLTASSFLAYVRRHLDNILIGVVWGPVALGFYLKAYQILMLPIHQVNGPANQVVVPALSRLTNNPERYRRFYCNALFLMTSLGMPLVGLAFVGARQIVILVLGNQWVEAVPIFLALAPAAFAGTINVAGGWLFLSIGRTDAQFRISVALTVFYGTAIVAGLPWGTLGVAIAYSIAFCAARIPHMAYAVHRTPIRLADVGRTLCRPAISAVGAVAFVALFVPQTTVPSAFQAVAMTTLCYTAAYCLIWRYLPGGAQAQRLVRDIVRTLQSEA